MRRTYIVRLQPVKKIHATNVGNSGSTEWSLPVGQKPPPRSADGSLVLGTETRSRHPTPQGGLLCAVRRLCPRESRRAINEPFIYGDACMCRPADVHIVAST